jgi:hypothetical protein
MAMPHHRGNIEGGTAQTPVLPSVARACQTLADRDLHFATERGSSPHAVGGKPKRQTKHSTHEQKLHNPPRSWASIICYSRIAYAHEGEQQEQSCSGAAVHAHRNDAQRNPGPPPGRSGHGSRAFRDSQPLSAVHRDNRNNCLRPVIWFLSRGAAPKVRPQWKILSLRDLLKLAQPVTKGNIAPFNPPVSQEKLGTRALFASGQTAATTETGQTKDIRYPVFIHDRRTCYQNN